MTDAQIYIFDNLSESIADVLLANEKQYNYNWRIMGRTVSLPCDSNHIKIILEELSNQPIHGVILAQQTNLDILQNLDMAETDIFKYNDLCNELSQCDEVILQKISACVYFEHADSVDEIAKVIKYLDDYRFEPDVKNLSDFGKMIAKEKELPFNVKSNLNMKSYGESEFFEHKGNFTSYGYVEQTAFHALEKVKLYSPIWIGKASEETDKIIEAETSDYAEFAKNINQEIKFSSEKTIERGLMKDFYGSESVKKKLETAFPSVENINGTLWGVTTVGVSDTLISQEILELKDFIEGQYSDGWGEEFEQKPIHISGEEIFVRFWNSRDFEMFTENEFSQQNQEGEMSMGGLS